MSLSFCCKDYTPTGAAMFSIVMTFTVIERKLYLTAVLFNRKYRQEPSFSSQRIKKQTDKKVYTPLTLFTQRIFNMKSLKSHEGSGKEGM